LAVFVSYSRRDKKAVKSLTEALQNAREQVWLDQELLGGDEWWRTILDQIRGCDVFIVALSRHYDESKACQAELRYAQDLNRPILPVQIGPVKSMQLNPLAAVQMIDFRDPTVKTGIELTVAVHQARAQLQPLPSPLPDEPPVPFGYLMGSAGILSATDPLAPEEQSAVFTQLKSGFREAGRDDKVRRDVVQLLRTLRDHPDVTDQIRTDVDIFLTSIGYAPTPTRWWRRKGVAIAATILLVLVNIAGAATYLTTRPAPVPPPPVWDVVALDKLLLSPGQINTIMGASNMNVSSTSITMMDHSAQISDKTCLPLNYPLEATLYAGSGWIKARGQTLKEPGSNHDHFATQGVVLFPSALRAADFYTASEESWPLCANITYTTGELDMTQRWRPGPVLNIAGTLTASELQEGANGWTCQRALTVSNVVAIDVVTCSYGPTGPPAATTIAHQIAAKVPKL
jgi:serine/threonine kinase PknH